MRQRCAAAEKRPASRFSPHRPCLIQVSVRCPVAREREAAHCECPFYNPSCCNRSFNSTCSSAFHGSSYRKRNTPLQRPREQLPSIMSLLYITACERRAAYRGCTCPIIRSTTRVAAIQASATLATPSTAVRERQATRHYICRTRGHTAHRHRYVPAVQMVCERGAAHTDCSFSKSELLQTKPHQRFRRLQRLPRPPMQETVHVVAAACEYAHRDRDVLATQRNAPACSSSPRRLLVQQIRAIAIQASIVLATPTTAVQEGNGTRRCGRRTRSRV